MTDPRIRFVRFSGRNAGPFREFDLSLDNLGFTFVRGVNLDESGSNGSGKSTLFDLFSYVHTGVTAKGPVKNNLINKFNPKDFELKSTFYVGEHRYDVVETRNHSEFGTSLSLYENGNDITPKTKLDDCRLKIMEKMGLSRLEFSSKLYVSQSYNHIMVSGGPSEKKKYLSTYFDLGDIVTLQDINKRNINSISLNDEKQLTEMLVSIEKQLSGYPNAETLSIDKMSLSSKMDATRTSLTSRSGRRDLMLKSREVMSSKDLWHKKLAEIGVYEASLDASYDYLLKRKPEIENILNRFSVVSRQVSRLDAIRSEISDINVSSYSYDSLNVEYQSNLDLLSKAKARDLKKNRLSEIGHVDGSLMELSLELDRLTDERKLFSDNVKIAESELGKLMLVSDKCHVCLRPMDPSQKAEMVKQRQETISGITEYLSEIEPKIRDITDRLGKLEEMMLIQAEISEYPSDDTSDIERRIASTKSSIDMFNRHNALLSELRAIESSISESDIEMLSTDEQSLRIELASIIERIGILKPARDFFSSVSSLPEFNLNEFSILEEEIRGYEREFSSLSEKLAVVIQQETSINVLNQQKSDIEKRLLLMTDDKRRHRVLTTMSSSLNNIKKAKLRRSSEILTKILPEYVKHLFNSRKIELEISDQDDSFELYLTKFGEKMGMKDISGGQGKRIGLAIAFAFAKLSKNPANILIVDEPYKDLDPQGRQACYELLRELNIPTILMTSHDTDQSNSNLYDREWCITMERGQSFITEKIINV